MASFSRLAYPCNQANEKKRRTNFKLYINIHNKYHLMIISFMECVISHKNEYYQNAGRTCKICKLKSVYIVLHYLSILFLLVILHCCYIYIYRFITVYILRQPLVVLLVSFTVSTTSCIQPCSVRGIPTTILNLNTCILVLCPFYSVCPIKSLLHPIDHVYRVALITDNTSDPKT